MAYALHGPYLPRRSPVLGLIVLMHAVVIYYVSTGIRPQLPPAPSELTLVTIAPLEKPLKVEKPPPPEQMPGKPTVVEAPPLPPVVQHDPPVALAVPRPPAPVDDVVAQPPAIERTAPSLDPRHPIGRPAYPPQSIRMNQEGLVRVSVCVQPDGRVTDVALAESSGYRLLDEAALKHLRRHDVRLQPGTESGRPVEVCTTVPIRFDISNR